MSVSYRMVGVLMKILVVGGTLFFGKLLVGQLIEAGHEVTILTRGNIKPGEFWEQITHWQCDIENLQQLDKLMQGQSFDVVIDTVSRTKAHVSHVLGSIKQLHTKPQYIFCSSIAVYFGEEPHKGMYREEDTRFKEITQGDKRLVPYINGKKEAEKYIIETHGDIPYTLIRPVVIEGLNDPYQRTSFFIKRLLDGKPIILSSNERKTTYRHVTPLEVAQLFFLAVGNKKAYDQAFNVAGKAIYRLPEYLQALADILEVPSPKICWIPQGELINKLPAYALPPFFQEMNLIPDLEKSIHRLGYQPAKPGTFLEDAVADYKASQSLNPSPSDALRDSEVALASHYLKNQ